MTKQPDGGVNVSDRLDFSQFSYERYGLSETPIADMNSAEPFDWDAVMNKRDSAGANIKESDMLAYMKNPSFGRDISRNNGYLNTSGREQSYSISVTADSDMNSPSKTTSSGPDLSKGKLKQMDLHTVRFVDNDDEPWGCCVNFDNHWSEWKITKMLKGQQAHHHGVDMGWRVRRVNNFEVSPYTCKEVKRILERGHECTITFETDPRKHLITQEGSRKWDSASVEREHEDMEKELERMIQFHTQSEQREKKRKTLGPSYITQQVEKLRDELTDINTKALDLNDKESGEVPKVIIASSLEEKIEILWKERQENRETKVQILELIDAMNLRLSHLERHLGTSASRKSSNDTMQLQVGSPKGSRQTRAGSERV